MAISGLLGQQNLLRLEIRLRQSAEFFAGVPTPMTIELINRRRWLPAFLIQIEGGERSLLFPLVPCQRQRSQTLSVAFTNRGFQSMPPLRISSRFPINFFIRFRRMPSQQQLLVFPQPLPAQLPVGEGGSRQQRQMSLPQPGSGGELSSIDNYRDGDPLKAIHWKLSARHDEYKVKRLQRLGAPAVLLDLNEIPGDLEEKLSRCTYLVTQQFRQQRPVGLLLGQRKLFPALGTAQRHKLLTELALYGRR